ncbi:MAG: cell division protein FtsL [Bacillota bacterium]|nr:cell division protein FtsL [Bacillota bacterium]
MIVANKQYSTNGNAALVPERKYIPEKKDLKNEQIQSEELKKAKQHKKRVQAKIIVSIFAMFVIGLTIVVRYSDIYVMQRQLTLEQENLNSLTKENEDMKLDLMRQGNLKDIEKQATEDLHMVLPSKDQAIHVDLGKNNFNTVQVNKDQNDGFINTIKEKLLGYSEK